MFSHNSLLRLVLFLSATAYLVAAHSRSRDPLRSIEIVKNPVIHNKLQRVNYLSHFDLSFNLREGSERIKLSLEPNHDILPSGATVSYLEADGTVSKPELIDRLEHKVFKGASWRQREDDTWERVGEARILILRDGEDPLFEGAFSVRSDNHHVLLDSTFEKTRDPLDPEMPLASGEAMILFRDSDIGSAMSLGDDHAAELKKRSTRPQSCTADTLEFNRRPDHPVYVNMRRTEASMFGEIEVEQLFGKRQIDQQGTGNGAGVDLSSTIGNSAGCPGTRKVALVGVATDCEYTTQFNNDRKKVTQNIVRIMNSASNVWEKTFRISLGLANLVISPGDCPASPTKASPWNQACANDVTIADRLNLFSQWRGDQSDSYSHWTLMTNCRTADEVGLAWLGLACVNTATTSNVTGGGTETVSGANVVAYTDTEWQVVAHETGHTFGAVHDCTSSLCSDGYSVQSQQCCPLSTSTCDAGEQYIMNPATAVGITEFSQCTLGNICSGMGRNAIDTTCLSDNTGVVTITGPVCGNGIVEQGEDCDCGGEAGCSGDPCCDSQTCKFTEGSVCDDANEDCCSNCQYSAKGHVCRASSGECDPQEVCSGQSGVCPPDKTAPNGRSCKDPDYPDAQGLTCASGQCTSRNLQCQTVMSSYMKSGNDTYACDDTSCILSCASPAFGANTCYGLQQNLLDGTPCIGGGHCRNGQCEGSSVGKEIVSWLQDHKAIVIGISCAIGVLLLLTVVGCIRGCVRRRKQRKRLAAAKEAALAGGIGPGIAGGPAVSQRAIDGTWYGPPARSNNDAMPPPVPPHLQQPRSSPFANAQSETYTPPPGPPPGYRTSQAPSPVSPVSPHQDSGWRPPPVSRPYSPRQQGMYGNGIIGARPGGSGDAWGSNNPFAPGVQYPGRVYSPPGGGNMRYA